jgi:hypothetical protein
MASSWRTVQLFISSQAAGIFEVEVDTETRDTRCNCPVWKKTARCKHTNFVDGRMKLNRGHYAIRVPESVPENLVESAIDDPKAFRDLILKYNKVEVL